MLRHCGNFEGARLYLGRGENTNVATPTFGNFESERTQTWRHFGNFEGAGFYLGTRENTSVATL